MTETENRSDELPVILIAGPTASGKSKIALQLAQAIGGEIVNADSMQVYRELRVLTARPSAADEMAVPHHLYGSVSAATAYSVGQWAEEAVPVINKIRSQGKAAIVVGGTGLYFRVLTEGLAEMPLIPDALRRETRSMFAEMGPERFHIALSEVDPLAAKQIGSGDGQRMVRALEVFEASGRSIVDWQADPVVIGKLAAPSVRFALTPPREEIYAKTDARLESMMTSGALEEVAALEAMNLDPTRPAMKALGVAALISHLQGKMSLEDALELAKTATRQYAKRQMTWIRNQMVSWNRVSEQQNYNMYQEIFSKISDLGLTLP